MPFIDMPSQSISNGIITYFEVPEKELVHKRHL